MQGVEPEVLVDRDRAVLERRIPAVSAVFIPFTVVGSVSIRASLFVRAWVIENLSEEAVRVEHKGCGVLVCTAQVRSHAGDVGVVRCNIVCFQILG